MPIDFDCRCGEQLRIDDKLAGSPVQCPGCRKLLTAPTEHYGEVTAARLPEPDPADRRANRAASGGVMNSGMLGGLATMAVAVVWFVGALALGWVFFYPPILFVLGLIGFVRGLASRGEDGSDD